MANRLSKLKRKIKCVLGHPLWMMRVRDTTEVIYENDEEQIIAFKCKTCGEIVMAKVRIVKGKKKSIQ